jgi:hypothetical protein
MTCADEAISTSQASELIAEGKVWGIISVAVGAIRVAKSEQESHHTQEAVKPATTFNYL